MDPGFLRPIPKSIFESEINFITLSKAIFFLHEHIGRSWLTLLFRYLLNNAWVEGKVTRKWHMFIVTSKEWCHKMFCLPQTTNQSIPFFYSLPHICFYAIINISLSAWPRYMLCHKNKLLTAFFIYYEWYHASQEWLNMHFGTPYRG